MSTAKDSNRLLAALSASDQTRLEPHLTAVKLILKQPLERPNKAIQDVYFIDSGIASVVAVQSDDTEVEIGLVGREGMTGSAVLLGGDRSPHSTYIQAVGSGRRIAADMLRKAAGVETGTATAGRATVGRITRDQVREIAQAKMPDLNANDLEAATKQIAGTARSMGIEVGS